MKNIFLMIFIVTATLVFAQTDTIQATEKSDYELKVFFTDQCFDCLVFEEEVLENPFFETYVNKYFTIKKHHTDSLIIQNDIFNKYNPENIYPLMVLVNHKKEDFIRIPYLKQNAENLVVILSKLKR